MKQFLTSEQVEILNKVIKFALPPRVVSLGDLLEILPEVIYHEGKKYERVIKGSLVYYYFQEDGEALEITNEYENCPELIDNLFYTCLSLKDTGLLSTDNSSGYKFDLSEVKTELNIINHEEEFIDDGMADLMESDEELDERNITEPVKVDEGIYILPEDFFNTTEEDYKKIKGKCFIRELGGFIVLRVEDNVFSIPDAPGVFLYEQYDQYNDGSWNCKDNNWLQKTAVYDPEYRRFCLTDQTDINIGSEEMYCLGKDGNLYVTLECGDEWLRFIPIDSDKFEKIKEEALRNFEEENGYDL